MIKRTLFFTSAAHLSTSKEQIVVEKRDQGMKRTIPSEDVGYVVLEHPQITMTQLFVAKMAEQNIAVIFCNNHYMPTSMLFHLDTHTIQHERFKLQLEAKAPFKKNLWKKIIQSKIANQSDTLRYLQKDYSGLSYMIKQVTSGDASNMEARAAKKYWHKLFGDTFKRDRGGDSPNHALNYGYTMLQFSVYTRHCASWESAQAHIKRVKILFLLRGMLAFYRLRANNTETSRMSLERRPYLWRLVLVN